MKTSELTGAALDWAVAKCEGIGLGPRGLVVYYHEGEPAMWQPSTNWAQGGPIIYREGITPMRMDDGWVATHLLCKRAHDMYGYDVQEIKYSGPTPLIAAMRCYVASKLGDEVDVPEELV